MNDLNILIIMQNEINFLNQLIGKLQDEPLNENIKKDMGHTPLHFIIREPKASLSFDESTGIVIEYNNNKATTKYKFLSAEGSDECSYSLDTIGRKQHRSNIIFALTAIKDFLENVVYVNDGMHVKYYNASFKILSRSNFKECYLIANHGHSPLAFLYYKNNGKLKICNCYCVAKNFKNEWNVFFDYDEDLYNSKHHKAIKKFNDESTVTVKNFLTILLQLSGIVCDDIDLDMNKNSKAEYFNKKLYGIEMRINGKLIAYNYNSIEKVIGIFSKLFKFDYDEAIMNYDPVEVQGINGMIDADKLPDSVKDMLENGFLNDISMGNGLRLMTSKCTDSCTKH